MAVFENVRFCNDTRFCKNVGALQVKTSFVFTNYIHFFAIVKMKVKMRHIVRYGISLQN